jgi:acyl dehydratase
VSEAMIDESAIGTIFTPVHATVDPTRLRLFFDAIGENNPVFRDEKAARATGFPGIPMPPSYLFCQEMMDADDPVEFLTVLDIPIARILHGEQSFVYHAPIIVGDKLLFEGSVTNVTHKKGGAMTLLEMTARVTNQDGVHVADEVRTIVVRNEKSA